MIVRLVLNPVETSSAPALMVRPPLVAPRLEALLITKVPLLIVVPPVYVFAPNRVQVPPSFFVTEPLVVPMTLEIIPLPAPARVNPKVAPVIVPVFVRLTVPLSDDRVVAPARVSNPP